MHTNNLYTASEIAKELNLKSATVLNQKLADMKIQYKINNSWVLYSKYADLGYKLLPDHYINTSYIKEHWDDILRIMVSLKLGKTTAFQLLKKLNNHLLINLY